MGQYPERLPPSTEPEVPEMAPGDVRKYLLEAPPDVRYERAREIIDMLESLIDVSQGGDGSIHGIRVDVANEAPESSLPSDKRHMDFVFQDRQTYHDLSVGEGNATLEQIIEHDPRIIYMTDPDRLKRFAGPPARAMRALVVAETIVQGSDIVGRTRD